MQWWIPISQTNHRSRPKAIRVSSPVFVFVCVEISGPRNATSCGFSSLLTVNLNYTSAAMHYSEKWSKSIESISGNDRQMGLRGGRHGRWRGMSVCLLLGGQRGLDQKRHECRADRTFPTVT